MKKLIENWNKHLNELGGEEGQSQQPQDDIRTVDGRKVQKMIGNLDQPREFVDFLVLLKNILKKPEVVEKIRAFGRKTGTYDDNDLLAIKRLSNAFNTESEPVGADDEQ